MSPSPENLDPATTGDVLFTSAAAVADEATVAVAPPWQSTVARWLTNPELMVCVLLGVVFAVAAARVPGFFNADYLFDRSTVYMEAGVMALAMTFVIASGHIDLSCASILALTGAIVGKLHVVYGVPLLPLAVAAPLIGVGLGAVNGLLVARLGLPSLVVTLATLATYRGLAQALIGDQSLPMPEWFRGFDGLVIPGTPLAMPVVVFGGLAVALGLVLHKSVFGRHVLAMGTNPEAALYSGVPVGRLTVSVFMLSGAAASVGALMMLSRFGHARWDHANSLELDVVTAVVLGGANIFGGRATIFGSVVAVLLVGLLQSAMGLANVDGEYQTTANGALLIFAVLASNAAAALQGRQRR